MNQSDDTTRCFSSSLPDGDNYFHPEKAFEKTMLSTLLVEFARDTQIDFSVIENPKFQAVLKYLRPDIELPSYEQLLYHNQTNQNVFETLETMVDQEEIDRTRNENVTKWVRNHPDFIKDDDFHDSGMQMSAQEQFQPPNDSILNSPQHSSLSTIGISSKECIFCDKKMKFNELREFRLSEAYYVLYLSLRKGVYSMDKAKRIIKRKFFQYCLNDLPHICADLKTILNIKDVRKDINPENSNIGEAYDVVEEIKQALYSMRPENRGKRIQLIGFCQKLRSFFEKYDTPA